MDARQIFRLVRRHILFPAWLATATTVLFVWAEWYDDFGAGGWQTKISVYMSIQIGAGVIVGAAALYAALPFRFIRILLTIMVGLVALLAVLGTAVEAVPAVAFMLVGMGALANLAAVLLQQDAPPPRPQRFARDEAPVGFEPITD
jgi:hypothetical protein